MIKLKAKLNNENGDFLFNYKNKQSNTLEHAILICKLWNLIAKNSDLSDKEIESLIKELLEYEREVEQNA